jgi:hypothetical protein
MDSGILEKLRRLQDLYGRDPPVHSKEATLQTRQFGPENSRPDDSPGNQPGKSREAEYSRLNTSIIPAANDGHATSAASQPRYNYQENEMADADSKALGDLGLAEVHPQIRRLPVGVHVQELQQYVDDVSDEEEFKGLRLTDETNKRKNRALFARFGRSAEQGGTSPGDSRHRSPLLPVTNRASCVKKGEPGTTKAGGGNLAIPTLANYTSAENNKNEPFRSSCSGKSSLPTQRSRRGVAATSYSTTNMMKLAADPGWILGPSVSSWEAAKRYQHLFPDF